MDKNMQEIVQLAVDAYRGKVTKYSVAESSDVLRQALIDLNGGSTKLDYRKIRDGQCVGLFALIEEILARTVMEGFQGDEYFMSLVDYRNLKLGDQNVFDVEDNNLFVVSEAADGTQGIRRQRLSGTTQVSIPTKFHVIKIYEELNRVLSGQVDMNKMITKVGESFLQMMRNDVWSLWTAATAEDFGGNVYFPTAGSYDEATLLKTIQHVEAAANGKNATILGTKSALRNLNPAIIGAEGKSDLYNLGYLGKFYGNAVVAMPQRHKVGTTDFALPDNELIIIAGDDKPIKFVYEGDPLIVPGTMFGREDLTQEYLYGEKYGMGLVVAGGNAGIGRYKITA